MAGCLSSCGEKLAAPGRLVVAAAAIALLQFCVASGVAFVSLMEISSSKKKNVQSVYMQTFSKRKKTSQLIGIENQVPKMLLGLPFFVLCFFFSEYPFFVRVWTPKRKCLLGEHDQHFACIIYFVVNTSFVGHLHLVKSLCPIRSVGIVFTKKLGYSNQNTWPPKWPC